MRVGQLVLAAFQQRHRQILPAFQAGFFGVPLRQFRRQPFQQSLGFRQTFRHFGGELLGGGEIGIGAFGGGMEAASFPIQIA